MTKQLLWRLPIALAQAKAIITLNFTQKYLKNCLFIVLSKRYQYTVYSNIINAIYYKNGCNIYAFRKQ